MYVRRKRVGDYVYYQLVESYRADGKVRQRVLAHLGRSPTLEEAIAQQQGSLNAYRQIRPERRAMHARSIARHEKKLAQLTRILEERSD